MLHSLFHCISEFPELIVHRGHPLPNSVKIIIFLAWMASSFYISVAYHNKISPDTGSSTIVYSVITATTTPVATYSESSMASVTDPGEVSVTDPPSTSINRRRLVIDHQDPVKDINLNFFQCLTQSEGFYCFSSDAPYCVAGRGSIPSGKVAVRRAVEHPFNFCIGKQIFFVVKEYTLN
jgi:hypothetical protein